MSGLAVVALSIAATANVASIALGLIRGRRQRLTNALRDHAIASGHAVSPMFRGGRAR